MRSQDMTGALELQGAGQLQGPRALSAVPTEGAGAGWVGQESPPRAALEGLLLQDPAAPAPRRACSGPGYPAMPGRARLRAGWQEAPRSVASSEPGTLGASGRGRRPPGRAAATRRG